MLSSANDLKSIRQQEQLPLLISLADSSETSADYFLEGTINGAGSAIKWAAKKLGLQSVESNLDSWDKEVEQPPLFYNSVGGIGSPIWQASPSVEFANRWFNQDLEVIPVDDVQAHEAMVGVLESIVFLVAMNVDAMRELGVSISTLRLSGGVTASRSLCQKLANLTKCRIVRPAETEATLLGVARLLALSSGQSGSSFQTNPGENLVFKPRANPSLQQRYQLFQRLVSKE